MFRSPWSELGLGFLSQRPKGRPRASPLLLASGSEPLPLTPTVHHFRDGFQDSQLPRNRPLDLASTGCWIHSILSGSLWGNSGCSWGYCSAGAARPTAPLPRPRLRTAKAVRSPSGLSRRCSVSTGERKPPLCPGPSFPTRCPSLVTPGSHSASERKPGRHSGTGAELKTKDPEFQNRASIASRVYDLG